MSDIPPVVDDLDDDDDLDEPEGKPPVGEPEPTSYTPEAMKEARRQAAAYRAEADRFAQAFAGIDEDDQKVLLNLARQYATSPADFAASVAALHEAVNTKPAPPVDDDPDKPVTQAQLNAALKAQQQQAEQEKVAAQVETVQEEATGLGYKPGSRDYFALLWTAHNETGGDLVKADATMKAERQADLDAGIEEFVAGKKKTAGDSPLVPTNRGGPAGEPVKKPPMYLPGSASVNPAFRAAVRGE